MMMTLDVLRHPYRWPVLGTWLKDRAQERGRRVAWDLYRGRNVACDDLVWYAKGEMEHAERADCDRWRWEAVGMVRGAYAIRAWERKIGGEDEYLR